MGKEQLYLLIGGGLVGVFILTQVIEHPKKIAWTLVKSAVMGCLFVFAVNWVGQYFHYHMPFNPFTALTAGLLGLPGVAALIATQLLLFHG
ncbi:pro-sigmaK processing inhibitor BofA family protein [Alicyclobacillus tolerans]|uniref:pro-sigmaK processing inhibitor BofA family protein n=1 Tax=Alicyclobacillus tolerans TaxID=90970 RepID=UPI001F21FFD3|nr:pro-sigmaK processing inhibitor BofA family protein [Alicyclobacillus tolerans]MCF8566273.1 pro-sigmaK processing inhibitor BofA family protein [Alicyclobacillus tolerans]